MDEAYTLGTVIEEESVRPSLSAGQEKGVQHMLGMSKPGARIGFSDGQHTGSTACAREGDAEVQNVASAEQGPGDKAPLEIAELASLAILKADWAGKASLAGSRDSNPDASHFRADDGLVDSTLGQLQDEEDTQSLIGSLFVRAEVAEKETEGFGRVVQRLQELVGGGEARAGAVAGAGRAGGDTETDTLISVSAGPRRFCFASGASRAPAARASRTPS